MPHLGLRRGPASAASVPFKFRSMLLILNVIIHFLDVFVARSCGIIPNYSLALCPQPVFVSFK